VGEIEETATERFTRLDRALQIAATKGTAALEAEWKKLDGDDRKILKAALDRRHKMTAREVDRVSA
jgi:hypothetical protein